jgi:hypothetical protein
MSVSHPGHRSHKSCVVASCFQIFARLIPDSGWMTGKPEVIGSRIGTDKRASSDGPPIAVEMPTSRYRSAGHNP